MECINCTKAQYTRVKDGVIFMQTMITLQSGDKFQSFRKHDARKHGESKRNGKNKVSMGDNENFVRDFPQNAPRVPKKQHPKGTRGSTNGGVVKVHGSRKIREVSGTGGHCKVLETRQRGDGFRDGQKMGFWHGQNSSRSAAEFSRRREIDYVSIITILWVAEVGKRSTYCLCTRKAPTSGISSLLLRLWGCVGISGISKVRELCE